MYQRPGLNTVPGEDNERLCATEPRLPLRRIRLERARTRAAIIDLRLSERNHKIGDLIKTRGYGSHGSS